MPQKTQNSSEQVRISIVLEKKTAKKRIIWQINICKMTLPMLFTDKRFILTVFQTEFRTDVRHNMNYLPGNLTLYEGLANSPCQSGLREPGGGG